MRLRTCFLIATLAMLTPGAFPAPIPICTAGPVSTVAGTTCVIEDLIFMFGSASIINNGSVPGLTIERDNLHS